MPDRGPHAAAERRLHGAGAHGGDPRRAGSAALPWERRGACDEPISRSPRRADRCRCPGVERVRGRPRCRGPDHHDGARLDQQHPARRLLDCRREGLLRRRGHRCQAHPGRAQRATTPDHGRGRQGRSRQRQLAAVPRRGRPGQRLRRDRGEFPDLGRRADLAAVKADRQTGRSREGAHPGPGPERKDDHRGDPGARRAADRLYLHPGRLLARAAARQAGRRLFLLRHQPADHARAHGPEGGQRFHRHALRGARLPRADDLVLRAARHDRARSQAPGRLSARADPRLARQREGPELRGSSGDRQVRQGSRPRPQPADPPERAAASADARARRATPVRHPRRTGRRRDVCGSACGRSDQPAGAGPRRRHEPARRGVRRAQDVSTAAPAPQAPQPVDLLIVGADILTFDDADRVIADGALAIDGNSIVWLGPCAEATTRYRAATTIDGSGLIALPGLIDCHFHTAQQFLRGKLFQLARRQKLRMPPWKNYYVPFEGTLTHDDVYCSGLSAYLAMISVGTTCFLEAGGPHPDAMGGAADEVGIRGVLALSTMDMDDTLPSSMRMTTDDALKANEALVKRWRNHPRVSAWLAIRQIIVATEPLQRDMAALARELDTRIHTHLAEGTYEVDFALARWGLRPAEYLD